MPRMTPRPAASTLLAAALAAAPLTGITALTAASLVAAPALAQNNGPSFEDVIKDLQPVPSADGNGLFQLYRADPNNRQADPAKLVARIPAGLLNQDLLFATTITGGQYSGYQWSDGLIRFKLQGNRLIIEAPDTRYVYNERSTVNDAVQDTYRPSILAALPIITMAGGDPVVDMGNVLVANLAQAPVRGQVSRSLVQYPEIKTFPDNVLIAVDMPFSAGGGAYETIGVAYSFRRLPALGSYRPRAADERVGYFLTAQQDWSTDHTERDNMERYINRWNLQKQDPSLELSPPVEPIVFIIEDTVPVQWRRWVRAGIEEWNQAFEAVGYSDAVVVYQQTDSNEFANIDPEDARYNFIRWIVSGRPFAMGPSRVDPRTGQILDADIIVDDSFLRVMIEDSELFSPTALAGAMGPGVIDFLETNPQFLPYGTELPTPDPEQAAFEQAMRDNILSRTQPDCTACGSCDMAEGLGHRLAMTRAVTAAMLGTPNGKQIPEEIIGTMIKDLVMHEVGHTLGLRHNFKASAWLTTDEIRERRGTGEPLVASVMDYTADAFFAGDNFDNGIIPFTNPTIGPYDHWAIEYGYKTPGEGDGGEDAMLAAIASRSAEPGLAYATDEDTVGLSSPDPLVNRWDNAGDPVAWAQSRIDLANEMMANLDTLAGDANQENDHLRQVFGTIMWERSKSMNYVSRIVSGQYLSRSRAADEGAPTPLTLVDPADQRAALDFLGDTVFCDDFWALDAEVFNRLPASRWSDWNTDAAPRVDYPVHSMVLRQQGYALMNLLNPAALQRVYDAEMKSNADDKFTVAEMIQRTSDLVWNLGEIEDREFTDAQPMLPSTRRNLQMQHLRYSMNFINPGDAGVSPDIAAMVRQDLRDLAAEINDVLETKGDAIDFASRAHLSETADRIQRALDAVFSANASRGGGGTVITIG